MTETLLEQLVPPIVRRIAGIPDLEPTFAVGAVLQLGNDALKILLAHQPEERRAVAVNMVCIQNPRVALNEPFQLLLTLDKWQGPQIATFER
jgi:hypothetical protein